MRIRRTLLGLGLAAVLSPGVRATDLLDVWRAAATHDPEFAAARAAHAAGEARREQASALWRPTVALEAGLAAATHENTVRGAQFSAPGFGTSNGVSFDTSVTGGTSTRYAVSLRQPLFSRERTAEGEQLRLGADMASLQWHAERQQVMLRAAERYFDAALAAQQLRLLQEQEAAVAKARVEAQDRFRIGDRPVTDVHEASARAAALRAQLLAAQSELELRRTLLADLMGSQPDSMLPLPAASGSGPAALEPLDAWFARAERDSPQLRLAQSRLRVAEQEARKTGSALAPTLDLVAQAGRDRLSGSGDFGSASNTAVQGAIGVQLTVPLYTGGLRSARNSETVALAAKASAELDRARQQVLQQARSAWLDLSVGRSRVAALESGWQASLARLDATRVGLQAGDRTTLDLLNAQNDAAAAELALLQARVQQLLQRLRLAAVAGTLDEDLLAATNRELGASPAAAGALASMLAFDAAYIPALAASTAASQDAAASARAQAALQSLRSRWPQLRLQLASAWGTVPPPAWQQALAATGAQIEAGHAAAARGDWTGAHDALEQVRTTLLRGRRAQGMDYFVDRLTEYHEPMEVIALAGSRTRPGELTPARRADIGRAHAQAQPLWAGIEAFALDAPAYGLDEPRRAQLQQGLRQERAALDALGAALQAADAQRLLHAAAALKPPFARVYTAFGRAADPPSR